MQINATDTSTSPPDKPAAAPPPRSNRASLLGALAALQDAQTIAAGASGDPDPGDAAA